jgi:hypothetical protein
MYLRFALGLGLLVTSAVMLSGDASIARAVTSLPTFGQPTITTIQGMGFEQGLRTDPTNPNRIYTSAPGSGGSQTSWIWHSEDGGKTFKWVTAATPTNGKIGTCPGGGDTELALDPAGRLYFADLTAANFTVARSDDHGVSFNFNCNPLGVPDAAVDRQWYATDGDPTNGGNLYLASNEIGRGPPVCGSSDEGNNTLVVYRSPLPAAASLAGLEFGPANQVTDPTTCDEGILGNVEVSPTTHHIFVVHDNADLNAIAIGRCVTVAFGAPLPGVSDPSGLNCVDIPVTSFPGFKTAGNFPNMAIDKNGNLYAVWEQAQIDGTGYVVGDTVLKYSYSTDDGSHWSTPTTIPTPGLHNNVYAWPAAGDDGRVDIVWYGTPATANDGNAGQGDGDPTCGRNGDPTAAGSTGTALGGPDAVTSGTWSVYMVQTLNGHAAAPTFTAPILVGEHYTHKGSLQTIIGGLCGNRSLGDFMQLRVGSTGEALISYADSNSIAGTLEGTHGMFVRQNGGTGLFGATSPVSGDPILINSATDPAGDGTYDAGGVPGASNLPNLDILDSSMSKPDPSACHPAGTPCYRVKMTINDLTTIAPPTGIAGTDSDLVWLTQWLVPAALSCGDTTLQSACQSGGKNFIVYAESSKGGPVSCWSGEGETTENVAGPTLTYPGTTQLTAAGACSVAKHAPGTITIDVPIAQVSLQPDADPLDGTLYSVTASTMTLAAPTSPIPPFAGVGGTEFNLIDVVRAYDANFTLPPTFTLAPKTNTLVVGKHECVTATVKTAAGTPASGVSVPFKVTGANAAGGTKSTNPSGLATFCYEGHKVGTDTITAYADFNKNKVKDSTEPSDTASATWVAHS